MQAKRCVMPSHGGSVPQPPRQKRNGSGLFARNSTAPGERPSFCGSKVARYRSPKVQASIATSNKSAAAAHAGLPAIRVEGLTRDRSVSRTKPASAPRKRPARRMLRPAARIAASLNSADGVHSRKYTCSLWPTFSMASMNRTHAARPPPTSKHSAPPVRISSSARQARTHIPRPLARARLFSTSAGTASAADAAMPSAPSPASRPMKRPTGHSQRACARNRSKPGISPKNSAFPAIAISRQISAMQPGRKALPRTPRSSAMNANPNATTPTYGDISQRFHRPQYRTPTSVPKMSGTRKLSSPSGTNEYWLTQA